MSTAIPQVPPRPSRSHDQKSSNANSLGSDLPKIPPRPNRRSDRSVSPLRESFAPSPLNDIPPSLNHGNPSRSPLYSSESANVSTSDLPQRPPSVALPTLGQEGSEYADVFTPQGQGEVSTSPAETRNVADDLKLHAPRPSLPNSSAKHRVSTVTRTDSGQAAAYGIGRATSDDRDPASRSLKARASFSSQTSNGPERPPSSGLESDHGIPEIGQRVPMYPNAGDVQAPSPSPSQAAFSPGVGFHNDGSRPRNHARKSSSRGGSDIPLDAYGKHGHGQLPHDHFEKAYYEKHPSLWKKETNHYYGPFAEERPEWAMTSEGLNKIVRDTARGAGLGTSPAVMSTPSEQIGFQASEEYASRISSPRPQLWTPHPSLSHTSRPAVDPPLRKESAPGNSDGTPSSQGAKSKEPEHRASAGPESEIEGEDTIHIDAPGRRISRIYGGVGHLDSTEDLGPYAGKGDEDGIHDEHGYGAPILASDEVAKEPLGWELQPAVSPLNESRANVYDEHHLFQRPGSTPSSRPASRPTSIHGGLPGFQITPNTTLEALDEYEPLFSDVEGKEDASNKVSMTKDEMLKRPELKSRKFPSQDIWEDTPDSLQYTATVSTPQLPQEKEEDPRLKPAEGGETPEQAFARRQEELAEKEAQEPESFLIREAQLDPYDLSESRQGMKQRFPSRDIWEDSPDSLQLHTTVRGPQDDEKEAQVSASEKPTDAVAHPQEKAAIKPTVPSRHTKTNSPESPEISHPVVPDRRPSRHADSVSPPLPMKPKPQVPARPSKPIGLNSSDNIPLAKVPSDSSAKSNGSDQGVATKPKPPVPSRPVGSKIAALQSGFMSDLNKRLQLGPHAPAPKKEDSATEVVEEEKEKAPLVDARKGRARGPARRAPAKSPVPATNVAAAEKSMVTYGLCGPSTLWHIDPEGDLFVPAHQESAASPESKPSEPEIEPVPSNETEKDSRSPSDLASAAESSTSQAPTQALETEDHAEQITETIKDVVATDEDTLDKVESKQEAPFVSEHTPELETAVEALPMSADPVKPDAKDAEE